MNGYYKGSIAFVLLAVAGVVWYSFAANEIMKKLGGEGKDGWSYWLKIFSGGLDGFKEETFQVRISSSLVLLSLIGVGVTLYLGHKYKTPGTASE